MHKHRAGAAAVVVRVVAVAVVEVAAKAEAAVVRVEAAIAVAVAVVRAAITGSVETARAATAVAGIASAPVIIIPGLVMVAQRVGPVTVIEIEIVIEIVTGIGAEIETVTGIGIAVEAVGVIGIVTGIVMIALRAARAFTSLRIMAAMDIARTPTTVAIRMVCTRAQTTRVEGKAMTRSVHTFTGMALMASPLLSVIEVVTNRLIGMASYVAMKRDSSTTNCISTGGAFTASERG